MVLVMEGTLCLLSFESARLWKKPAEMWWGSQNLGSSMMYDDDDVGTDVGVCDSSSLRGCVGVCVRKATKKKVLYKWVFFFHIT